MMHRTVFTVSLFVILSVLVVTVTTMPEARAATLYVGGGGPGNYTTIQDAVDNASPGDTVFVYGGTYLENVIVNRTLTLIGEDRNTTVIDGNASGDVVHVTANWVNVSGFTITSSGDINGRAGIEINRSHDCSVAGNSITDNNDGLYVLNSNYTSVTNNSFSLNANNSITVYASHNSMLLNNIIFHRDASLRFSDGSVIVNNSFSNNGYGIDLMNISNSTVSGNTFLANNGGIYAAYSRDTVMASNTFTYRTGKIYLSWSANMTLVNNDFAQGGILLWGENMADHNTHTITGNQVGGLPIHYYKDCNGVMVDGVPIGQLFMANCSNVRASNLDFFNVTVGIEMAFVDGGLIENVSVAGARYGIFLHQSNSNLTIADSNISGNWGDGITVRSSANNTISNTTTSFNSAGIWLYESTLSTVQGNMASNNTRGILSSSSGHDTIRNNIVIGNIYGLHVGGFSHNSTVVGNNISESTDKGIILTSTRDNVVANNTAFINKWGAIYVDDSIHNLIVNNTGVRSGSIVSLYDSSFNTVVGNTAIHSEGSGIGLTYSHNNTLVNNTVELSNTSGISLVLSTNNTIVDNHLLNTSVAGFSFYSGIYLSRSDYNNVHGNRIFRDEQKKGGIYLECSIAVNVTGNTMNWSGLVIVGQSLEYWNTHRIDTTNTVNGKPVRYWKNRTEGTVPAGAGQVILANCTNISVVDQNLSDGAVGLMLGFSSDNTLSKNTLSSNYWGVYIYRSDNNTVKENEILNNFQGTYVSVSQDNRIFHNEFVDNTVQALDCAASDGRWDDGYPSAGNYWSDYAGIDNKSGPNQDQPGSDGIGDTPYPIQVGNEDRFPLMSPSGTIRHRPPKITSTTLSGRDMENITLIWSLSPDDGTGLGSVTGYTVFRNSTYDSSGLSYQFIAFLPNGTSAFVDSFTGNGDPSGYFYRVCAVDADNNTKCSSDQAAKFTRSLSHGPNLVSVPLILSDESIETVFQTVKYDNAWTYDSSTQTWRSYTRGKPYNAGVEVNNTMGLWVNVTENSNLTLAGVLPPQTTIQLCKGWNMVSFPSFNSSHSVADLKLETGATKVEGYDSTPPYHLRILADSEVLQAGCGYWVHVDADINWVVRVS